MDSNQKCQSWDEAQRIHHLSNRQVRLGKKLRLNPKIFNHSDKSVGKRINSLWGKTHPDSPEAKALKGTKSRKTVRETIYTTKTYAPTTVATSLEHLLRTVAFYYIKRGFTHVVVKDLSEFTDLETLDAKVIAKCKDAHNKGTRRIAYMRFKGIAVLLATPGINPNFDKLGYVDVTKAPIYLGDYSIGYRSNTIWIQLNGRIFANLKKALRTATKQQAISLIVENTALFLKGINVQRQKLITVFNEIPSNNRQPITQREIEKAWCAQRKKC